MEKKKDTSNTQQPPEKPVEVDPKTASQMEVAAHVESTRLSVKQASQQLGHDEDELFG